VKFKEVLPTDKQVMKLMEELDAFQIGTYGAENCKNLDSTEALLSQNAYMLGIYDKDDLVGMGAIKRVENYAEIKRMYICQSHRGLGLADTLLDRLESYMFEKGINTVCLETGIYHYSALKLYERHGYEVVKSFGYYTANDFSVYMQKKRFPKS